MSRPAILLPDLGVHNADLEAARTRLIAGQSYRDCSTVCLIPTRGGRSLVPRVVQSWMSLMTPMNQKFVRLFLTGMEVGEAYSHAIDTILAHDELKTYQYVLTLEDDNLPPPDGLLKLLESIQQYDAVGGLYWTKGPGGMPMIYGEPTELPRTFRPLLPVPDAVQPCNGLGMGFTLFRMAMLRDATLPRPLFKTQQQWDPQRGIAAFTQDLYFFNNAAERGYKVASDNRVKVGHLDVEADLVW